ASGSGLIATVTLTSLTPGTSALTLQDIIITTTTASAIPIGSLVNGSVTILPAATPTPCPGVCPTATPTVTRTPTPTPGGQASVTINPAQQIAGVGQNVDV